MQCIPEHRVFFSMKINGYYKGIVFSELTYHWLTSKVKQSIFTGWHNLEVCEGVSVTDRNLRLYQIFSSTFCFAMLWLLPLSLSLFFSATINHSGIYTFCLLCLTQMKVYYLITLSEIINSILANKTSVNHKEEFLPVWFQPFGKWPAFKSCIWHFDLKIHL